MDLAAVRWRSLSSSGPAKAHRRHTPPAIRRRHLGDCDRSDGAGDPEDGEQLEDVGAHDVPHRHLLLSPWPDRWKSNQILLCCEASGGSASPGTPRLQGTSEVAALPDPRAPGAGPPAPPREPEAPPPHLP